MAYKLIIKLQVIKHIIVLISIRVEKMRCTPLALIIHKAVQANMAISGVWYIAQKWPSVYVNTWCIFTSRVNAHAAIMNTNNAYE